MCKAGRCSKHHTLISASGEIAEGEGGGSKRCGWRAGGS